MARFSFRLELVLVACGALLWAACEDDATDLCVGLCEECPQYPLAPSTSECDRWCDAWTELADVTGCTDVYEHAMECLDEIPDCGNDGGQCDGPDNSFFDCMNQYCNESAGNEQQCDDVWESNGIPTGGDPPN